MIDIDISLWDWLLKQVLVHTHVQQIKDVAIYQSYCHKVCTLYLVQTQNENVVYKKRMRKQTLQWQGADVINKF